ncbi:type I CRISPR-associated protein Cas8a1/Csx8 [Clostridium tetani]|uniref:type I CRISPR-associated protein Cas8a1/Csx8 n=1 Tax=Clostridium tetani TaxID=1513 RepID=UPI002955B461|nr:type I CRISPR-associated protein Cas8a1/Csx8 [Clostridium tetani]BDR69774.1 type I CRISPR-associated protein Cas8a1/Csx8 [Clostridium tetani]BDR78314.1 type I CRISPR-associated protein Cas8a1/Csx8 [Clostridium tetani]BEV19410.1 type I CRISPR-associated protein Cas8a1/Csx8 [Clostridium tetani]
MKTSIQNEKYDTMLEPSDWRFSAAIVGLLQYLNYHDLDYKMEEDYILYNSSGINEERYLDFVEYKYGEELHHRVVENILSNEEITEEQLKLINEKLVVNIIMKKTFGKIKFDNTNKKEILDIINKNRYELIRETFRRKSNMYANYANTNQLFKDSQDYCRLNGYDCADKDRKTKALGFNFNKSSYMAQDIMEFDFIPFAFEGSREAFFINDNYTIQRLKMSNETLSKKIENDLEGENKRKDARQALFKAIMEASDFIKRDVEIILKDISKEYFETLYIRKESIDIFKKFINEKIEYKSFCFSHKVTDKYYINIQKKVTESILNNVLLDELIEIFLKEKNRGYLVSQLIKINVLIRRDKTMKDRLKGAFACAKQVSKAIESNKLDSYKQKLTSSIIFKDYDRVCQILLQLSNYSGIEFGFVYDLYDDFEENKDLAYTFINALSKKSENN